MPDNSALLKAFTKEHGRYVKVPDTYMLLFEDGAQCEVTSSGVGVQMPPPDDEWERAQLVADFYEIKANAAIEAFHQFQSYLEGNGCCPEGIYTDEQKLAYLKKLRAKARTAKANYRKASDEVNDLTPAWMIAKEREEARAAKRQEKFRSKFNSIKL
jgi:hypothetical protein